MHKVISLTALMKYFVSHITTVYVTVNAYDTTDTILQTIDYFVLNANTCIYLLPLIAMHQNR